MILGRLFKKGTVQNTPDGSVVLVNEDNISYNMDKADVAVCVQTSHSYHEAVINT